MVSDAIGKGDVQAINYFIAQRYVDALKEIASARNEKVIMLPMELTGILGSLAGIGELAGQPQRLSTNCFKQEVYPLVPLHYLTLFYKNANQQPTDPTSTNQQSSAGSQH